jgi:hypothetical protein
MPHSKKEKILEEEDTPNAKDSLGLMYMEGTD